MSNLIVNCVLAFSHFAVTAHSSDCDPIDVYVLCAQSLHNLSRL